MEFDLSQPGPPLKTAMRPSARHWFLLFLLFVFLFLVFFFLNFQRVVVKGESMYPTFNPGQRILVCKAMWLVGPLRKNDVVVIKRPDTDEYLVKRVRFLEGEEIDRSLQPDNWSFLMGPYRVPQGHIYVLGDNLNNSEDSRVFGPIPLTDVLGKVIGG